MRQGAFDFTLFKRAVCGAPHYTRCTLQRADEALGYGHHLGGAGDGKEHLTLRKLIYQGMRYEVYIYRL